MLDRANALVRQHNKESVYAAAENPQSQPGVLLLLSKSSNSNIRARVAANPSLSVAMEAKLADDVHADVRAALAVKLGGLDLAFEAVAQDHNTEIHRALIDRLSRDRDPVVRRALAQVLAANDGAPRSLLVRLAMDHDPGVYGPVVRQSGVLRTVDLAAMMKRRDNAPFYNEIASREHIDETLTARLIAAGDEATITVLINNHTAVLSDQMITHLASRATGMDSWRRALARRPDACRRLPGKYVGGKSSRQIRRTGADAQTAPGERAGKGPGASDHICVELPSVSDPLEPYEEIFSGLERHLGERLANGTLSQASIIQMSLLGQHANVWVALSLLSGAAIVNVHQIMTSKTPRTILALAWQAGLAPETAVILQHHTAGIAPKHCSKIIQKGVYPLPDKRLRWLLAPYRIDHNRPGAPPDRFDAGEFQIAS